MSQTQHDARQATTEEHFDQYLRKGTPPVAASELARRPGPILMSRANPDGAKLEDHLAQLIDELRAKTANVRGDASPVAEIVARHNVQIMDLLAAARVLQLGTIEALAQVAPDPGPRGTPRVGV
ncbi:hypothetical protein [Methylobacterium platani]|uniref:Uncharacterized protein n=1 Tax=Methylobacterium platani TaxID=427683 RepID=A0A179SEJ2_9HYPH|nr:hypothetical protein [Methylobacterium platani]OAS26296.1 hypothetical protein A5481_06165 [Methylobacterium platani]